MYKTVCSVVLREIHGAFLLVDITAKVENDTCVIYELDPLGALFWRNHEKGCDLYELVEAVKSTYENIPDDTDIEKDIVEFLGALMQKEFLTYEKPL